MDTPIPADINSFMEFIEFPKMPRLSRDVVVTEKIDGTNAQIYIEVTTEQMAASFPSLFAYKADANGIALAMQVGSRSRWLTRETDNFGFAKWVDENKDELFKLGPGRHFGEWWGSGVQRGYNLPKGEKRFSLFNTGRWMDTHALDRHKACIGKQEWAPDCCHVVPVLWRGIFNTDAIQHTLWNLQHTGSVASPGFMKPEGVVIFHEAGRVGFKKTIDKDESPKSLAC